MTGMDSLPGRRRALLRLLVILVTLTMYGAGQPVWADGPSTLLYPSPNERLGFGVVTDINRYDLSPLHAGWYVNWGASSELAHPAGLDYAQIIRVGARISPDYATIRQIAAAQPGSLWLIGNEPDCIWQDNVRPEIYAVQYHDLYAWLKDADPTCQVAIGGVVQATPLRLEWLDRVWNAYLQAYGEEMPVDVWNVHNFILQERRGSWGCDIPPGIDAGVGMTYGIGDHDNMTIFRQQIVDFRQWMADHGQRDRPLIVSEYGILFHDGLGYDYARTRAFMLATFDYFMNATDSSLGYAADGNRLVQRWAWYSLDDPSFEQTEYTTWSALYNPFPPYDIRQLGQDFGQYAQPLVTPYVDLVPTRLFHAASVELTYGATVSIPLTVTVRNLGNVISGEPIRVEVWDGDPAGGGSLIGVDDLPAIPRRYAGDGAAHVTWNTVITGTRTLWARVNPDGAVSEWNTTNNALPVSFDVSANLSVVDLDVTPATPLLPAGGATGVTLRARVVNAGGLRVSAFDTCFWGRRGDTPEALLGCVTSHDLGASESTAVELVWGDLAHPGLHHVRIATDASQAIFEATEDDNASTRAFLVAGWRAFWPLVLGSAHAP
jgi:hypothetical protein